MLREGPFSNTHWHSIRNSKIKLRIRTVDIYKFVVKLNIQVHKYVILGIYKLFTKQRAGLCANWMRLGASDRWSWYNGDQVLAPVTSIRGVAVVGLIKIPASSRWLDSAMNCAMKSVQWGSVGTWTQTGWDCGILRKSAIGTNSLRCREARLNCWTGGPWRRGTWIAGTLKSLRTCCL